MIITILLMICTNYATTSRHLINPSIQKYYGYYCVFFSSVIYVQVNIFFFKINIIYCHISCIIKEKKGKKKEKKEKEYGKRFDKFNRYIFN